MSYGFFVQMESYEVSPGQCWGRDYLASQNEFSVLWFQWTHFSKGIFVIMPMVLLVGYEMKARLYHDIYCDRMCRV